MMTDFRCPKCSAELVVPIVYGPPTPETLEAMRDGYVMLGGLEPRAEDFYCRACEHRFSRTVTPAPAPPSSPSASPTPPSSPPASPARTVVVNEGPAPAPSTRTPTPPTRLLGESFLSVPTTDLGRRLSRLLPMLEAHCEVDGRLDRARENTRVELLTRLLNVLGLATPKTRDLVHLADVGRELRTRLVVREGGAVQALRGYLEAVRDMVEGRPVRPCSATLAPAAPEVPCEGPETSRARSPEEGVRFSPMVGTISPAEPVLVDGADECEGECASVGGVAR